MSIGSNIKKLRRDRDITQERLAELLGLTPSAVSQWETDRVLPDVTQIPQLANIFRVSADVILGIDVDTISERVTEICNEAMDLGCKGRNREAVEVCRRGLAEFPDSYELMEELASRLFYMNYPESSAEYYPEIITLYEKILAGTKDEQLRNYATGELCALYTKVGRHDEACRLAESVPRLAYTADEIYLMTLSGERWASEFKERIDTRFNGVLWNIRSIIDVCPDGAPYFTEDERLELYRKLIVFIETYYENGDYGFEGELLAEAHFGRASIFADRGDVCSALGELECMLRHVLESDRYAEGLRGIAVKLPEEKLHTSILARSEYDGFRTTSSPATENGAGEYLRRLSDARFNSIRGDERFRAVEVSLRENAEDLL